MGRSGETVELPGHGRAPDWDTAQDYQTQARDLALAALSGPTHLVGHSYGGTVALRIAVERPDLVRSLVLIEPVFFKAAFETDEDVSQRYIAQSRPIMDAISRRDFAEAAEGFSDVWNGVPWGMIREKQQRYMTDRIHLVEAGAAAIVEDNAGLWPRLGEVEVPVLLLEGNASPEIVGAIMRGLAGRIPHAERAIIEEAGHMGPITHPAAFAEKILTFQQRH